MRIRTVNISHSKPTCQAVSSQGCKRAEHDTVDACWVVKKRPLVVVCACRLACLVCHWPILTAELLPAWLVQCGFGPLKLLLRLVRGCVIHDEHPAKPMVDTQRRHDEVLHHGQPLLRVGLHMGGMQLQMWLQATRSRQHAIDHEREREKKQTRNTVGNVRNVSDHCTVILAVMDIERIGSSMPVSTMASDFEHAAPIQM